MTRKNSLITGWLLGFLSLGTPQADTLDFALESRSSPGLVIYNNDLALVNEAYVADLPKGDTTLQFGAVSPSINHASAVLHPLPSGLRVLGQYFRPAMTPADLLEASVGKSVSLVRAHPQSGEQTVERARVISISGGLILEVNGHYETDLAGRRIVFDELPDGVSAPTLEIDLRSDHVMQPALTLSYLTGGINWQADYVARLNKTRSKLELKAMATLSNFSGTDFQAASVELIAGHINQVRQKVVAQRSLAMMADSEMAGPATSLADLYLYRLPEHHDLANNSTRQLFLFEAKDIPVAPFYRLHKLANLTLSVGAGEQKLEVDSYIEFLNMPVSQPESSALGQPMPAGVVRIYAQADATDQGLRFIGEDRIGHTAKGVKIRLKTGRAFDLGAKRKQLSYVKLPVEQPFRRHTEVVIQTVLSNAGVGEAIIQVEETFAGQWQLLEGPEPDERDSGSARWNVRVPASGETTLTFKVRVKA